MRRLIERAAEGYAAAQRRAQRRRSPWNLILIPLGLAGWLGTWYGLFRLVWALNVTLSGLRLGAYRLVRSRPPWQRGLCRHCGEAV